MAFCSNFHLAAVTHLGLTFRCAEAAFQAAKFRDPNFQSRFCDLDGASAKRLGKTRHPSYRPDWDQARLQEMRQILESKFADANLRAALVAIGETELVEANTWGDTYWGVSGGRGEYHLGKLLMELRESFTK